MAYENELETWWAGMPGPIQDAFGFAYNKADELLKAVAGDPQDLARAGGVYANIGNQITNLGSTVQSDANSLAGAWEGQAYTNFKSKVDTLQQAMKSCGGATAQTQEILNAAAQAAVDGANTIVDIVVTVIEFALGTLALAAATAIVSLGASMAAWMAEQLASAAEALAEIMQVVTKVAQVLEKVAEILTKISKLLEEIAKIFMEWAKFVKGLKLLPKAWTADGVGQYVSDRVMKALINEADHLVGMPTMPSGITKGLPSVGHDVGDLNDDVHQAENVG